MTEAMVRGEHDDFYRKLRRKIVRWAEKRDLNPAYRDYVLALPDLFHLLTRLLLDERVGTRDKVLLGVGVAYVVSPLDLIPDILGPVGYLDDLIVMVVVLDTIFKRVPRAIVLEHWAGSGDVFRLVRESLDKADQWVGKGMLKRLDSYVRRQGGAARPSAEPAEAQGSPAGQPATKSAPRKKAPRARPRAKSTTRKSPGSRRKKPGAGRKL